MQVSNDTQKRNPWTDTDDPSTLTKDTQLYFVDKIQVDGQWYLRTVYDRDHNISKGVLQTDVGDIPFQPLDTPRYMELSKNAHKINPRNQVPNIAQLFPAGSSVKFTSKINVNGTWFFRTEYDEQHGNIGAFYMNSTREVTYQNFAEPRYMEITTDTKKINPATGEQDSTVIPAGTQLRLTSKAFVGGQWYYRTDDDTANSIQLAIPSSNIKEVPYQSLTPNKWFQLKNIASKLRPSTGTAVDSSLAQGTRLHFTNRVQINGQWFYRTDFDTLAGLDKGIPESDLEEIPYIPLENPRAMKLKQDTQKMNPKTGESVDSIISKDTSLTFTTKIEINGRWFLRTASDTDNNLDKAIPQDTLEEL